MFGWGGFGGESRSADAAVASVPQKKRAAQLRGPP